MSPGWCLLTIREQPFPPKLGQIVTQRQDHVSADVGSNYVNLFFCYMNTPNVSSYTLNSYSGQFKKSDAVFTDRPHLMS